MVTFPVDDIVLVGVDKAEDVGVDHVHCLQPIPTLEPTLLHQYP